MEFILMSRNRLFQYCAGLEVSSFGSKKTSLPGGLYHVASMWFHRFRDRKNHTTEWLLCFGVWMPMAYVVFMIDSLFNIGFHRRWFVILVLLFRFIMVIHVHYNAHVSSSYLLLFVWCCFLVVDRIHSVSLIVFGDDTFQMNILLPWILCVFFPHLSMSKYFLHILFQLLLHGQ